MTMTNTLQDAGDVQIRALRERQAQLEHRVEHYSAAVPAAHGHDPCLGRELDGARSLLAQVVAELAVLQAQDPDPAA
jgi:hypothetical protein